MINTDVIKLFGKNFIGLAELTPFFENLGMDITGIVESDINFSDTELVHAAKEGYIKESDIARLLKFRSNPSDESWREM